jgi:hypothetical protein
MPSFQTGPQALRYLDGRSKVYALLEFLVNNAIDLQQPSKRPQVREPTTHTQPVHLSLTRSMTHLPVSITRVKDASCEAVVCVYFNHPRITGPATGLQAGPGAPEVLAAEAALAQHRHAARPTHRYACVDVCVRGHPPTHLTMHRLNQLTHHPSE